MNNISAANTSTPLYQKQNLQEPDKVFKDLPQFLLEWESTIDNENPNEELQRIRKWVRNLRAYRGESRGFMGPNGEFVPITADSVAPSEASLLLVNNQFRTMSDILFAQWSRSQPRYHCNPVPNTDEIKAACRFADKLINLYQRTHLKSSFKQREARYALLAGNYFRYTYFAKTDKTKQIPKPVMQPVSKQISPGGVNCTNCQYSQADTETSKMSADTPCPTCEGQLQGYDPINIEGEVPTGEYEFLNIGGMFTDSPDPIEVKVQLNSRSVQTTPWIRRKRRMLLSTLQAAYSHIKIPAGPSTSQVSRYAQELEASVGNQSQMEAASQTTYQFKNAPADFNQIWLDKELYLNTYFDKDTEFSDGHTAVKGTPYTDEYPNGIYYSTCNGVVLDVQDEDKNVHWNHGGYHMIANSFWADGIEDLVQLQQYLNEMQSLNVENLLYNASPKLVVNPNLVDPSTISGKPRDPILMSAKSSKESDPQKAIYQLRGMSNSQELMASASWIIDSMKNVAAAKDEMAGSSDPHNQTASGQAIARNQQLALMGPPLEIYAEVNSDWCFNILELTQQNWIDGRYKDVVGYFDEYEEKMFKNCNIREQIEITVEDGSWIPRTMDEVRNNFILFLTANGLPNGFLNPQTPPEIRKKAIEYLQLDFDIDKVLVDERNANMRINLVKAIVRNSPNKNKMNPANPDEVQIIASEVKPDIMVDSHQEFINTYTEWLKTDDARLGHPMIQAVVRALITMHFDGIVQVKIFEAQKSKQIMDASQGGGMQTVPAGAPAPTGPPSQATMNPNEPTQPGAASAMPGVPANEMPSSPNPGATPPSVVAPG